MKDDLKRLLYRVTPYARKYSKLNTLCDQLKSIIKCDELRLFEKIYNIELDIRYYEGFSESSFAKNQIAKLRKKYDKLIKEGNDAV